MLAKSKGYFLLDLLLAMNVLLIISLTLLPLFLKLERQTHDMMYEKEARELLFDGIQEVMINGTIEIQQTKIIENRTYEISVSSVKKEGCVKYVNAASNEETYCQSFD